MTEDILFDNIYVGHSVEDAKRFAEETFEVKAPIENAAAAIKDEDDDDSTIVSFAQDPIEYLRQKALTFIELARIDPVDAFKSHPETGAALIGVVLTFFGMLGALFGLVGSQQKPVTKVCISIFHICLETMSLICFVKVVEEDGRPYARRQEKRGKSACRACRWG